MKSKHGAKQIKTKEKDLINDIVSPKKMMEKGNNPNEIKMLISFNQTKMKELIFKMVHL